MIKMTISSGTVHGMIDDIAKILISRPKVLEIWEDITPLARNEYICWTENAKKAETRDKRVKWMCENLLAGKRRPCCWAGCRHR